MRFNNFHKHPPTTGWPDGHLTVFSSDGVLLLSAPSLSPGPSTLAPVRRRGWRRKGEPGPGGRVSPRSGLPSRSCSGRIFSPFPSPSVKFCLMSGAWPLTVQSRSTVIPVPDWASVVPRLHITPVTDANGTCSVEMQHSTTERMQLAPLLVEQARNAVYVLLEL